MSVPTLKLRLGHSSEFRYTKSGALHGPISLLLGDEHFPAEDWTDFPLVVVRWWLTSLSSWAFPIHLEFMEGPYEVVLRGPVPSRCRAEAKDTGSNSVESARILDCTALTADLESAATELLRQAQHDGKGGEDFERLRCLL